MKDLQTIINEEMITEAAAKDVKIPRKGSTLYILKDGESKAIKVTVANVTKIKNSWYGRNGGYDVRIELSDNEYIDGWTTMHYGDPRLDEPVQVKMLNSYDKGNFCVGTSREAVAEFIKNGATKELKKILKQIEDAENQLVELNKKKDALQNKIDTEITESLK